MIPFDRTATLDLRQPLKGTTEAYVVAVRARIYADYRDGDAVRAEMDKLVGEISQTHVDDPVHLPADVAQGLIEEVSNRRRRQTAAALNHTSLGGLLGKAAPHVVAAMAAADSEVGADSDEGEQIEVRRRRRMTTEERQARNARLFERRMNARKASIPATVAARFSHAGQAILGTIAFYVQKFGTCKLSVRSLAIKACCSERTVQYVLAEATQTPAILRIKRRRWMTNVVTIVSDAWRDWWNKPWLQKRADTILPGTRSETLSYNSFYDTPQGANVGGSCPEGTAAESPVEAREPLPAPEAELPVEPPRTAPPVAPEPDLIDPVEPITRSGGCEHLFDCSKRTEWEPPKPVAPVTRESIGHGPQPTTVRRTFDSAINAIVDRFKAGTAATPAPVDPTKLVHGDAPDPETGKAFAHLDEMVAKIAASRTKPEDPDAPLSEWEKPEPALRDTRGRRWVAEYGAVEELTHRRYPRVLEEGVMHRILGDGPEVSIARPVLDWLREYVGSSEIAYSFRHLQFGTRGNGTLKLCIAFRRPQDLFAFRMAWGGAGPNPV